MSYTAGTVGMWAHCVTSLQSQMLYGLTNNATTSIAWPTQYLAIYTPIVVPIRRIVRKLGIANGSSVAGNFDLGLYDAAGTRLVSTGSTAQSGTVTEQVVDVTDTTVGPGAYYLAACFDGTSGTVRGVSLLAPIATAGGILTETLGSVVLPATASWGMTNSLLVYPMIYAFFGTTVA